MMHELAARVPLPSPRSARAPLAGPAPLLFLWCGAMALSPLLVFGSGSFQPWHVLLVLGFLLVFSTAFVPVRIDATLALIGGFWLADVAFVNVGNWLASGQSDAKFIWTVAAYWFNGVVMVSTAALAVAAPSRFARAMQIGIVIALAIELAVVASGFGIRARGTFENPNQLGYWTIAIAACWLALKDRTEPLYLRDWLVVGLAITLCFASSSRAAALGAVALLATAIVFHGIRKRMIPAVAVVAVAAGIVAAVTAEQWTTGLTKSTLVDRFSDEKKHDSLAGRGYDRIWLYPQYLLTGAGEGAYDRFAERSAAGSNEIHSSFATIVFGYGIVGTALFCLLLLRVFSGAGWRMVALAAPIGVYGVAHQGLRLTLLWVFLGLVVAAWMRAPTAKGLR